MLIFTRIHHYSGTRQYGRLRTDGTTCRPHYGDLICPEASYANRVTFLGLVFGSVPRTIADLPQQFLFPGGNGGHSA
jgi:hypothetical protein